MGSEEDRGFIHDCVDDNCPQFVQDGCGCDACCGKCADCLETIIEISEEYQEEFEELGGEQVQLVESLNDHPQWVEALKNIILATQ